MLTDMQRAEIAAAAHLGGLLMDKKNTGWEHRVNPGLLRMQDGKNCVLGQSMDGPRFEVFSSSAYNTKLRKLGITPYDQARYGFNLHGAWEALADAWRHEIAVRVAPTTVVQGDLQETLVLVA